MPRIAQRSRLRPRIEPLEARSLLSGVAPGTSESLLLRFAPSSTPAQEQSALASVGASVTTTYPDGPDLILLDAGVNPAGAIRSLNANPAVVYAEADATIHASAVPVSPNDPGFGQLWGLNNANNVDINAPEAWGITTGNAATIVAVIDSGIDLSSPDFAGKLWTNPVNDAAQGYPNDIHGWNFLGGNNDVQDDDSQGHGSHVSGIIAAAGNNGYGVVGVDWNAQIMPLKFLDHQGNGSTDAAVSAIYYAVNHGARVINASWGGVAYSRALNDAIAFANLHNVVFVTASGNDGTNNDSLPDYPASFRQPNELSVAAIDRSGALPGFSNYGATTVDLAAPGVDILSDAPLTVNAFGVQVLSGTSMATAYVSGVAALLAGAAPNLSAAQIVQRIDATVKPLPSLVGKTITGGMVDAGAALASIRSPAEALSTAGQSRPDPVAATVAEVHASILASDEFFGVHGGTAQGFIAGVYQGVLGRAPDPAGLQAWVGVFDSGLLTRDQIALALLSSPEARLTEVAHWFQDDLRRTASLDSLKADSGVAAWAGLLDLGLGDDTVEAGILGSPEYGQVHGGTPDGIARGFYRNLDDRDADPAGLSAWVGLLNQGLTPSTVVRYFQGTPESLQTKVARWFHLDLGRASTVAALKADPGVQALAAGLGSD